MPELDEITDAELRNLEAEHAAHAGGAWGNRRYRWIWYSRAGVLIKALCACRQQIELMVENLDSFRAPVEVGGKQLSPAGRVFALGERDEKCRAQSKAKDAAIEAMSHRNQGIGAQPFGKEWRVEIYFPTKAEALALLNTLAALEAKGCSSRPS